jgi:hypothetical protein
LEPLHLSTSFAGFCLNNRGRSLVCHLISFAARDYQGNLSAYGVTTEKINYLTLRGELLTFLPAGKEHLVNPDGGWSRINRQEGRPAKVVRSVFEPDYLSANLTDKDFETFANLVKAQHLEESGPIGLVEGDEIRKHYHENTYADRQGTLNGSCMGHDHCQNYFGIYTQNPDVVKLLVSKTPDGLVTGRALVWTVPEAKEYKNHPWPVPPEVVTRTNLMVMDRIYGTDATVERFKGYARDRGWYHKQYQDFNSTQAFVSPEGELRSMTIDLDLPVWDVDDYPYMDTMKYLSYGGKLSNHSGEWCLDSTSGNRGDSESDESDYDDYYSCTNCGWDSSDEDDLYSEEGSYWCESCYADTFGTCASCGGTYRHGRLEEVNHETYCRECLEETHVQCVVCEEWTDRDETQECRGEDYCESCWEDLIETALANRFYHTPPVLGPPIPETVAAALLMTERTDPPLVYETPWANMDIRPTDLIEEDPRIHDPEPAPIGPALTPSEFDDDEFLVRPDLVPAEWSRQGEVYYRPTCRCPACTRMHDILRPYVDALTAA